MLSLNRGYSTYQVCNQLLSTLNDGLLPNKIWLRRQSKQGKLLLRHGNGISKGHLYAITTGPKLI